MRKKFLFLIFLLLISPVLVSADSISCDKTTLAASDVATCTAQKDEGTFSLDDLSYSDNFSNYFTVALGSSENKFTVTAKNQSKGYTGSITFGNTIYIDYDVLSSDNSLTYLRVDGDSVSIANDMYYTTTKSSVSINASSAMNSTCDGCSGTKSLIIGLNEFAITVTAEDGTPKEYTLYITREEVKDNTNTLKSLSLSRGTLSPKFASSQTSYTATVANSVSKIMINATLTSNNSTFVSGYSPRTVNLNVGENKFEIRVRAQSGNVKVYYINITRSGSSNSNAATNNSSNTNTNSANSTSNNTYLKSLSISNVNLAFDKTIYEYNVSVLNEVTKLDINAQAESASAKVSVTGGESLQEGSNVIIIKVTNGNQEKVYTVNVERKKQGEQLSTNNFLQQLSVKGYKLNFNKDTVSYNLKIKNEESLNIMAISEDEKAIVRIKGNHDLKNNSVISIIVVSENGEEKTYTINIEKSINIVNLLIISLSVLILGLIIFLVIKYRKNIFKKRKKKKKIGKGISANILSGSKK